MSSDDSLLDYFYISIIDHYSRTKKRPEEVQQSLNKLGFQVGYELIEK
jgi:hypothetical protein